MACVLWVVVVSMVISGAGGFNPPLRGEPSATSRELLFVLGWGSRSATGKSVDGGDAGEAPTPPSLPFSPPSCADCLELSQFLLDDLWDAYPHKPKVGGEGEDEDEDLVGHAGQRRRMVHVWSELEINAVLDATCSKHASDMPVQQCEEVVSHTRDDIENFVFSNGPEGVRELLCSQLLAACQLHEVESGGELR